MNKFKLIFSIIIVGIIISCSSDVKTAEVKLDTMQCGMCKSTISEGLANVEGIIKVKVDVENKLGRITYKSSILNLAAIEKVIASLGYNANDTKADPEVYDNLAPCCKVPGLK